MEVLNKSTQVINCFACIHLYFHSYAGFNNSLSLVSPVIAMMQSKNHEYSYFLLGKKEVDSVAEAYFCTRAVDEEED